jgi:hypothetical protein
MKGFSSLFIGLALAAVAFGCGGGTQESEVAEEPAETPAEPANVSVQAAISHAMVANDNKLTLAHPVSGEEVELTFHFVHEGVHETASGRYASCVDFMDADGTMYDVDVYCVKTADGAFEVAEAAIHKVGGEEVITAEERERLEQGM